MVALLLMLVVVTGCRWNDVVLAAQLLGLILQLVEERHVSGFLQTQLRRAYIRLCISISDE